MRDEMTGAVMDPDNTPASAVPSFQRTTAEVTCILCGRQIGMLRRDAEGPVMFKSGVVEVWLRYTGRALRCEACGGAGVLSDLVVTKVRQEPAWPAWDDQGEARRGRPPRWLVDARARARARGELVDAVAS